MHSRPVGNARRAPAAHIEDDDGKGRCAPNFMQPKVVPIDRPEEA